MYQSTMNKGFHITYANGITVSVQWGPYNYTGQQYSKSLPQVTMNNGAIAPAAEVAAWDEKNNWITNYIATLINKKHYDNDIMPEVTPDELVTFMYFASILTPRQIKENAKEVLKHEKAMSAFYGGEYSNEED